jgi:hypothetical protein
MPSVSVANVPGDRIQPDEVSAESIAALVHGYPSGAFRYRRKDGRSDEGPPESRHPSRLSQ